MISTWFHDFCSYRYALWRTNSRKVYNYISSSYLTIVTVLIFLSNNYSHKRGRGIFARKKYPIHELLLKMGEGHTRGGGRILGILRYMIER